MQPRPSFLVGRRGVCIVIMTDLALASEFPAASREAWLALVDGVLKGADFDRRLVARTYDALALQPLEPRKAGARPLGRARPGAPWLVAQRIDHPDAGDANRQTLDDLMGGANALTLVFSDANNAHGFGLKDASRETLTRVLGQVHLDMGVTLMLDVGRQSKDAGVVIGAIARSKGLSPADLDIHFGYDPLGLLAAGKGEMSEWAAVGPLVAGLVRDHRAQGFKGPFLSPDGRIIHAAGGSEAQELAFVLASGVAYLRALEAGGLSLEDARDSLSLRLAVDADQFLSIAKLRAARRLWAEVETACGLEPKPVFIAAETAWRMMTRTDANVNMLRTTVACFAGAVGGADLITVLPYSAAQGLPEATARRLARNTQIVLAEEASLARIADPAAGSGTIEAATDALVQEAWQLFADIEAEGGLAVALPRLAANVTRVRAARIRAVASRKDPLTGTSEFPNIHEAPAPVAEPMPAVTATGMLAPCRLSEAYETLRGRADAAARTGQRPAVFLANLGTIPDFTARTIFAKNFFQAGGLAAPANDGFADTAAMVAAFRASGARIACLCSSDAVYASDAVRAAGALIEAGASLYLAGKPGDLAAALETAGVTRFVFAGCDAVATLTEAQKLAGL